MRKKLGLLTLCLFIGTILFGCTSENKGSNADWNANFVVWEGHNYVVTNEDVDKNLVGAKVGTINTSSSNETDVKEGETFSNIFPTGTEIYEIKGVKNTESLAVKNQDGFVKIDYNGEYGK
ncbi:hypothetical protein RCG19_21060 [Neobacillus sp. OS1-2]|uniref:hypothetical protein n=1 Tax=Neobacillus sp. OS1-2 TaxID=3070680 RepID=UPI0027DF38A4|nr:hypothetical protein [Neobacillus sp. OS1-2]WML39634.1 hypothetical protein RCG19_21060 [Neobacillus sp. OS1-2]